jgi:hypothetical protein
MLYYSTTNLINAVTLHDVSSENTLYVMENLYDGRPSKPFYFTAKTSQWITVDLDGPAQVQFCGIFNHNFKDPVVSAGLSLILHVPDPDAHPVNNLTGPWLHSIPLTYRLYDLYGRFDHTHRWWHLNVEDGANTVFPRIGELWLGALGNFPTAHIQPGRDDGSQFYASEQVTQYGQDWDAYYSESKILKIKFSNLNDPAVLDAFETFLTAIGGPAGRFVLIPDHHLPHVYMVKVMGSPSARRIIYNPDAKELREWTIDFKVLTRGITLL